MRSDGGRVVGAVGVVGGVALGGAGVVKNGVEVVLLPEAVVSVAGTLLQLGVPPPTPVVFELHGPALWFLHVQTPTQTIFVRRRAVRCWHL